MDAPTILTYHQISELDESLDPYHISVSPSAFAKHMAFLSNQNYNVMSLKEAVTMMRNAETLPQKSVVISFDDGYRDNLTNALPILQQYNFPATLFVVADMVGKAALWDGEIGAQMPLMTWDEIRQMQSAGIEIGGHTRTHPALDELDEDQLKWELCTSKQMIEEQIGTPVETLAYPYERFNQKVQDVAEQCGYLAAFGTYRMAETYYNIWRLAISTDDSNIVQFQQKLESPWKMIATAKLMLNPIKKLITGTFSAISPD